MIGIGVKCSLLNDAARRVAEIAKYVASLAEDGREKSLPYLRASSSVEESDSKEPPGQRNSWFKTSEVNTRIMENAITSSGLILTPSVSSLKNVSSPALDAGRGLPFFLPLITIQRLR